MLPWSADLAGRIDERVISSELLRGNPLGDPSERPLWVYVPPGYEDAPDRRYPAVYVIQGFTGNVAMWRNRSPYRLPFPEAADAVFAGGQAPPAIVVYVDAWTGYGGSQFVDSPGTGRYHSYLCDEVVPWVDGRYRTLPDSSHRAIMGKSSGVFSRIFQLDRGHPGSITDPLQCSTKIIHKTPKRSVAIAKRGEKNVFVGACMTLPPSLSAANSRSTSASSATESVSEKP